MFHHESLDCRGLPEAIAVLRIKQALHCATTDTQRFRVQISDACCPDTVEAGLGADAACVSLKSAPR